jgi:hypothetical protein
MVPSIDFDKLTSDIYYTLALDLQHHDILDQAIEAMKRVIYIDRKAACQQDSKCEGCDAKFAS